MPITGDRLDRYEIIAEIGAGAFGVVYRARHLDILREDALKVPHHADLARRFLDEARLVARLRHPNIVSIYSMNSEHNPPYIAFELIEGRSLRQRMAEVGGPLDCDEVVEVARQVLEGLAAAHEAGIVHRDLKPENILIARDGTVKVSDFGLGQATEQMSMLVSRSISMGGGVLASQLGVSRAQENAVGSSVAGTIAYMAPEQEDGLELDGRADLFALGIMMYELVTGARPRGRFKDPVQVNPGVSAELNALILRALETERDDRFPDAGAMLGGLSVKSEEGARQHPKAGSAQEVTASQPAAPAKTVEQQWSEAEAYRERMRVQGKSDAEIAAALRSAGWRQERIERLLGEGVATGQAWSPGPGTHVGQEIIGPADIPLVWVPSGSFMMGSDEYDDEKPVHRVELSGFWIGKTEVTVAQWRTVMGSVPRDQQGDDHPVVHVSWNDAKEFCEKLGLQLPTEAQWEYAARGPESRKYPWGNDWDKAKCCNTDNHGPGGRTFPVGSFPAGASWCGALDMAGNVWEWCADWFNSDYYASSPDRDPSGPSSGDSRVLRGGSWYNSPSLCRSAYRFSYDPSDTYDLSGFRVARS